MFILYLHSRVLCDVVTQKRKHTVLLNSVCDNRNYGGQILILTCQNPNNCLTNNNCLLKILSWRSKNHNLPTSTASQDSALLWKKEKNEDHTNAHSIKYDNCMICLMMSRKAGGETKSEINCIMSNTTFKEDNPSHSSRHNVSR